MTLRRDTRGAHLVEYVMIVGFVAVIALAGFRAFGMSVEEKASQQAETVQTLAPSGGEAKKDDGCGGFLGCLVDGAKDIGGDLLDAGGDVLGFGASALTAVADFQLNFAIGFGKGAFNTVVGLGDAIIHPVRTFKGLQYAANHPFETIWNIGASYTGAISENPAQGLGAVGFDALLTAASFGSSAAATSGVKGLEGATKAAKVGSNADTVADIANEGNEAAESNSDVPGFIKFADEWVAPNIMPSPLGPPGFP